MNDSRPLAGILLGSLAAREEARGALELLAAWGVPHEATVASALHTPARLAEWAEAAEDCGMAVLLVWGGGEPHLAAVVAAHSLLPVIDVEDAAREGGRSGAALTWHGADARPDGAPVLRAEGAEQAALAALRILARLDIRWHQALTAYHENAAAEIDQQDERLRRDLVARGTGPVAGSGSRETRAASAWPASPAGGAGLAAPARSAHASPFDWSSLRPAEAADRPGEGQPAPAPPPFIRPVVNLWERLTNAPPDRPAPPTERGAPAVRAALDQPAHTPRHQPMDDRTHDPMYAPPVNQPPSHPPPIHSPPTHSPPARSRRIRIDSDLIAPEVVAEVVDCLLAGGVVAIPTDTVYGLAVDATNPAAAQRLYILKNRPESKAMAIFIDAPRQLHVVAVGVTPAVRRMLEAFWPGPLTVVFQQRVRTFSHLATGATIGIRFPDHSVPLAIMQELCRPLACTSANLSGRPDAMTADEIERDFGAGIDLILDAGRLPPVSPSTVIDVTREPFRVVREGAVTRRQLTEVLGDLLE